MAFAYTYSESELVSTAQELCHRSSGSKASPADKKGPSPIHPLLYEHSTNQDHTMHWISTTAFLLLHATSTSVAEQIDIRFRYDAKPNETLWTLDHGKDILFYGPAEMQPKPYDEWDTTFEDIKPGDYRLSVYDNACDGIKIDYPDGLGFFQVWLLDEVKDEEKVLLAKGDKNFTCAVSFNFTVPEVYYKEEESDDGDDDDNFGDDGDGFNCKDDEGYVLDVNDDKTRNCKWLAENLEKYDFLCDWADVALSCPVTCEVSFSGSGPVSSHKTFL